MNDPFQFYRLSCSSITQLNQDLRQLVFHPYIIKIFCTVYVNYILNPCNLCAQKLINPTKKKHELTHKMAQPYMCFFCNKTYFEIYNLTIHSELSIKTFKFLQLSSHTSTSTTQGRRGCAWPHTLLGTVIQLFNPAFVHLFQLLPSLGPYCGVVCEVEVAWTVLKLTETDGRAGGRTGTSKYRDAMRIQKLKLEQYVRYFNVVFQIVSC